MKASKDMLLREIAGECLLIPVGEIALKIHGMITLSESGSLLWKKLSNEECTKDQLVQTILSEYEIDEQTAREDVEAFISKMRALGIIEE